MPRLPDPGPRRPDRPTSETTPSSSSIRCNAEAAAHRRAAGAVYAHAAAGRVMQFPAAGFDVSLEQMQAPLLAGACVVVRGSDVPGADQFVADAAALELLAPRRGR